jgi:hypothetical protein
MSFLDRFRWIEFKGDDGGVCNICEKFITEHWILRADKLGFICIQCVATIATMHNLKADEIK